MAKHRFAVELAQAAKMESVAFAGNRRSLATGRPPAEVARSLATDKLLAAEVARRQAKANCLAWAGLPADWVLAIVGLR